MTTRAEIRKRVVETLRDRTDVADRVFSNRARQLWPEELPAIMVYTRTESASEFGSAPRTLKREIRLAVEVVAKADEDLDDELDRISEQVEALIGSDDTLGGTVADVVIQDLEMSLSGQGETVFGSSVMTFRVTYFREIVADSSELPNLERVNIKYDLTGSDPDTVENEQRIEIP